MIYTDFYDESQAKVVRYKVAGGSGGGGGHTIVDASGNELESESKLKFVGANVTDDSLNETTVVTIPSTTFNGRSGSIVPVAGDYNATQVDYDNNTTVKAKIDSLVTGVASFNGRSGSIVPAAKRNRLVFALVGGVMVSAFNSSTSTISSRIAAEDNWDGK